MFMWPWFQYNFAALLSLAFKNCPFTLAKVGITPSNDDCSIKPIL